MDQELQYSINCGYYLTSNLLCCGCHLYHIHQREPLTECWSLFVLLLYDFPL